MTRTVDRAASRPDPRPARGEPPNTAIPKLLTLCGDRILALSLRLCRNSADADDLVQEVFLRALRSWSQFRGESDPCTWMYAIALNTWRSRQVRKGGIDRRTPALSQILPWGETSMSELALSPRDQDAAADRRRATARVQAAIMDLPEHWRLPLVLKDVFGVTVADVGAALGLAENTVKTRLHRARLSLRKAMLETVTLAEAPAPIFNKQVCVDLLRAKMEAMDRGGASAGFGVPRAELCARCRGVFSEFDLVQGACADLASARLSPQLRARIKEMLAKVGAVTVRRSPTRRGRKPVRTSGVQ
jgi:RNA polymerase sigma-70 factor, ECF subfamily